MKLCVIDSGTTNTRVRLIDGEKLAGQAIRACGARDVAIEGSTKVLEIAVRETVSELLQNHGLQVDEIEAYVASGMITSNMGLFEVPYIAAPVGIQDLIFGVTPRILPNIFNKPILFIPGIKTGFSNSDDLSNLDMIRGEETEIFGCLSELNVKPNDSVLFIHFGSHHKAILWQNGQITNCFTSLTGELMMAVSQNTILKNICVTPTEIEPQIDYVLKGIEIAEAQGFGRSLFSSRVLQVMCKEEKQACTSLVLGALLYLDLCMLQSFDALKPNRIIMYGKHLFSSLMEPILKQRYPHTSVTIFSETDSENFSWKGSKAIYEKYKTKQQVK